MEILIGIWEFLNNSAPSGTQQAALPLAIPLIMAAIGAGSKIYGGIKGGQANKANRGLIEGQMADQEAWYNTEYNKDYLQSNVAGSAITRALGDIEQRNQQTESTAAITGASDASVLASKANSQNMFSELLSRITAQGTAQKDRVRGQHQSSMDRLFAQLGGMYKADAANAANVSQAGGQLMSSAGSLFGSTKWGSGEDIITPAGDDASEKMKNYFEV